MHQLSNQKNHVLHTPDNEPIRKYDAVKYHTFSYISYIILCVMVAYNHNALVLLVGEPALKKIKN